MSKGCNNGRALCVTVFDLIAERRGRSIGGDGGLRQRQSRHRSGRQRSARLPSSGMKRKHARTQIPPLIIFVFFCFRRFHVSPGKPSASLLRQDLPFGYRLSRRQNRTRLLLQRVSITNNERLFPIPVRSMVMQRNIKYSHTVASERA